MKIESIYYTLATAQNDTQRATKGAAQSVSAAGALNSTVNLSSMSALGVGDTVPFTFPPQHVHVFTADGTAVPRVDVPAHRVPA